MDHLPEELFVHLTEDVRGQDSKLVRTIGVVEPSDDVLERLVIDDETERQRVWRLATLLHLEVEESRVVAIVSLSKQHAQAVVDLRTVQQRSQLTVFFDRPALA